MPCYYEIHPCWDHKCLEQWRQRPPVIRCRKRVYSAWFGSTWFQLVTPVMPSISAAMRDFHELLVPLSFLEVIGDVDDNTLKTLRASAVEQGGFDHQRGLVVEQLLPPPGRDEFW